MIFSKFVKTLCLFFFLTGSISITAQTTYLPSDQAMENIVTKVDEIGAKTAENISDLEVEVAVFSKSMYKMIQSGMQVSEAADQTVSAIETKYSNNITMMNNIKDEVMALVTSDS